MWLQAIWIERFPNVFRHLLLETFFSHQYSTLHSRQRFFIHSRYACCSRHCPFSQIPVFHSRTFISPFWIHRLLSLTGHLLIHLHARLFLSSAIIPFLLLSCFQTTLPVPPFSPFPF